MKFSETHEIPKVLDTETDSSSDSSFVEVSEINNMNRGKFCPLKAMGSNLTNVIFLGMKRSWVRTWSLSLILKWLKIKFWPFFAHFSHKCLFLLTFMVSKRVNLYPVFTNDVCGWSVVDDLRRWIFARWEGGRGVLRWDFDYFKITHTVKNT